MFEKIRERIRRRPLVSVTLLYLLLCVVFARLGPGNPVSELLYRARAYGLAGKETAYARVLSCEEKSKGLWAVLRFEAGSRKGLRAEGYVPESVLPGDLVYLECELSLPEPASNPGQFDARLYYAIRRTSFFADILRIRTVERRTGLRSLLFGLRLRLQQGIRGALPEREAGELCAILLGSKGGVDPDAKELFQKTGIAHLFAISGLHVGVFFESLSFLFEKILGKRCGSAVTLVLLWLYVAMTGASVSALRAAFMLTFRKGASLLYKEEDPLVTLAESALAILLIQPLEVLDSGFQLSFLALLGLRYLRPTLGKAKLLPRKWREKLLPSLAATLATFPLQLRSFFRFCPYSVLLNLAVVPLMNILFPVGALGALTALFWPGGGRVLLGACSYLLRFYEILGELVLRLPFSVLYPGAPSRLQLAAYYAILLLWIFFCRLPEKEREKRLRREGIVLFAALSLCLLPDSRDKVCFLNVGQGACAVLRWNRSWYLVDAGPSWERVIKPYLLHEGATEIRGVFLSHPDEDHRAGLDELLADGTFSVGTLYLADTPRQDGEARSRLVGLAENRGVNVRFLHAGEGLSAGPERLTCISPAKGCIFEDENDSSLVLYWDCGAMTVLFPGDLGEAGERLLLSRGVPETLVLAAGHHGSSTSSSAPFLRALSPGLCVVSAKKSVYGHPHEETLDRLASVGARVLCTEAAGAVTLTGGRSFVILEPFLSKELFHERIETSDR